MRLFLTSIVLIASATAAQACDALALGVGCYSQPIRQQAVVQRVQQVYAQPIVQQVYAQPIIQQQVEYVAQPVVQKVIQRQKVVQRVQRIKVRAPLIQRQKVIQRSVVY